MKKCIFFDRDGVVNQSPGPGYVERWEDFHILPEFVDILRQITQLGYVAVIISNQRGAGCGVMTIATLEDIHHRLQDTLKSQYGLELLDIFYCAHDRDAGCECRKPKPGMILEAARKHSIDLAQSWMIGDSPRDAEAGRAAGCRTILITTATPRGGLADIIIGSMAKLRDAIGGILMETGVRIQN